MTTLQTRNPVPAFNNLPFGRWSIRFKITLIVLLGVIGMTVAVGLLMFSTANTLFAQQAEAQLSRQNEIVAGKIENLTTKASDDLLLARQNPVFNQYFLATNDAARQVALQGIQTQILYLQDRYAIDEICVIAQAGTEIARCVQGELTGLDDLSPDETGNPFFQPTLALEDGQVYRTTVPYVSPDTHRPVVAHTTPIVLPNEKKAGVLHFEIPLVWFAAELESNSLTGGYSFLMTKDGLLLVHPRLDEFRKAAGIDPANPDQVNFPSATMWGNDEFHQLVVRMTSGEPGKSTYHDGQETYLVVYQPVLGGNWVVATVLPQSVIYQSFFNLLRQMLLIAVPLLIVIVGLMLWYTTTLVAPIIRLTTAVTKMSTGNLVVQAPVVSNDEIGTLATAFNRMAAQLRETLTGLEQRVADRTRRLEIIAALGEHLSAILNLEKLLAEVVNQVKDNFGYYHVHIYLLDDKQEKLVVAEGTGSAGAEMKAKGHSIPLDAPRSLVARAARSGEIVRIDNVHEAEDWLPNPLLPDTYSEIAVPIVLEGQGVGVLDVQQNKGASSLDEGDANLLRTLASQVAVAICNARLFDEVETALAEAKAAQTRYLDQAWDQTKIAARHGQYHFARPDAPALAEATLAEANRQALAQDHPAVVAINGDDSHPQSVVAPVTLRNRPIGALQLHPARADQTWTEDDLAIVEAVVNELGQTAETLRLFEDTRERARHEQTIREITHKLRAAPNLERLIEIASEELGQRLAATHAKLELGFEPAGHSQPNHPHHHGPSRH